jgi:tripartite ATP-independent transporter DctM subunit
MILPPSVLLIVLGLITEQSIGKLFLAGLVPGLMIAALFLAMIAVWARIDPGVAPRAQKGTVRERIAALPELIWAVVVFGLIIGGLMKGLYSPTEAGSIGLAAILIMAFTREKLRLSSLFPCAGEALESSCMTFMLVACSTIFGHFLTITEIPMKVALWATNLDLPAFFIMMMIMFIYLLGGSFMDDVAFMILATPIFYPIATKLGYDPMWFAILISITVMIGIVIPPVALGVFLVKKITGESFGVIYRGVYPFLAVLIAAAVLIFVFPQIVTFLPNMAG